MQTVIRFSEITGKLVRILMLLPGLDGMGSEERSIRTLSRELNQFLEEMIGAFNIRDSVLIGDLLEYEIVPRIEELIKQIEPELGRAGD